MADVKTQRNTKNTTQRRPAKSRRRRRSPMLRALLLMMLAAGGVACTVIVLFRVQQVRVTGSVPYTQQQIVSAMGIGMGQNLLSVDRAAAERSLCTRLPYIRTARVKLQPFSTMLVAVEKDMPAAVVQNGTDLLVVDSSLKLLEIGGNTSGLPRLAGLTVKRQIPGENIVPGDTAASDMVEKIIDGLSQSQVALSKVTSVSVNDPYDLTLRYENRIDIVLGTSSDLAYKIKTAAYIIKTQLSAASKGRLDVSRAVSETAQEHKIYFDPA